MARAHGNGGAGQSMVVAGGTVILGAGAIAGATQTDHTAPILAFVGALLVALIAAYAADRRQETALAAEHGRQETALEAEHGRQETALEAERSRLDKQLHHDRTLADRAELRTIFDDALDAYDAVFRRAGIQLVYGGGDADEEAKLVWETAEALHGLNRTLNQMRVRLGGHHPCVRKHRTLVNAASELCDRARDDDVGGFKATVQGDSSTAYNDFVDEVQRRVGADLGES